MDHKARVFLHELDHINGMAMTHWRLSEGKIDIIDSDKDSYKNLQSVSIYNNFCYSNFLTKIV